MSHVICNMSGADLVKNKAGGGLLIFGVFGNVGCFRLTTEKEAWPMRAALVMPASTV